MSGQGINVVFDYLLIEDLCLVNLLHQAINTLLILNVPFTIELLKLSFLVTKLHQESLVLGSLALDLSVQVIIFVFYLTNLLIWQVDCSEDIWLRGGGAPCRRHSYAWHTIRVCVNRLASTPDIAHVLLLSKQSHRLWREMRNFLRLLLVVVVDVLLYRVTLCKHVQDLPFIHTLLDTVCIALFLHFHDFLALNVEDVLAALKSSLQFSFLLLAFAELPLALMNHVLLESDLVELSIKLAPIRLKSICS